MTPCDTQTEAIRMGATVFPGKAVHYVELMIKEDELSPDEPKVVPRYSPADKRTIGPLASEDAVTSRAAPNKVLP